jgi:hypothetical protein
MLNMPQSRLTVKVKTVIELLHFDELVLFALISYQLALFLVSLLAAVGKTIYGECLITCNSLANYLNLTGLVRERRKSVCVCLTGAMNVYQSLICAVFRSLKNSV